jgi:alkylhydroperoxidase family enzyme
MTAAILVAMKTGNTTAISSDRLGPLLDAGGEMARAFEQAYESIWQQPHLPAAVLELCRLRLARMHGATAEIDAAPRVAIDAAKRAAVLNGNYSRDDRVSPAERAVVEFCEVYAMDAQAITDELAAGVVAHFGEPGLVALIEALGFIDGRMRLARMLGPLLQGVKAHA